ncbi:Ube3b protein [Salpingoeca rosetta]|uniref:HECT-type E3 ubiquitin transferase n=1 Tax=Salpingoeca rosetta (strain ATCC 50818 / BSB-021) TaxID=946362 RepID=F2ULS4_SALR5|nr:Ube3b protein [Salpingoeca rosetta]EGD78073.1 Ube3b protein [Salpingoeca rosetta]|eukprot:XP_004989749.1 Ube3b protein [Salpingoeca rosetta]
MFFTGDHKKRKVVSLGGRRQQQQSASDARQARQARQRERKQKEAAERLQEWWRQRYACLQERQDLQRELDSLLESKLDDDTAVQRALLLIAFLGSRGRQDDTTRNRCVLTCPNFRLHHHSSYSSAGSDTTRLFFHRLLTQDLPQSLSHHPILCGLILHTLERVDPIDMPTSLPPAKMLALCENLTHAVEAKREHVTADAFAAYAAASGSCLSALHPHILSAWAHATDDDDNDDNADDDDDAVMDTTQDDTQREAAPTTTASAARASSASAARASSATAARASSATAARASSPPPPPSPSPMSVRVRAAAVFDRVLHVFSDTAILRTLVAFLQQRQQQQQQQGGGGGGGTMDVSKDDGDGADEQEERGGEGKVEAAKPEEGTTHSAKQQHQQHQGAVARKKESSGGGFDRAAVVVSVYTQLVSLLRSSTQPEVKAKLTQMLTQLSAHDAFVSALWSHSSPHVSSLAALATADIESLVRWSASPPAAALTLLCDIIHHHFVLVDDADFWAQVSTKFGSEEDFKFLLRSSRDVCANLFLSTAVDTSTPRQVELLRRSLARLLRAMYLRDDRLQYLGRDFWTAPALTNSVQSILQYLTAEHFERPEDDDEGAEAEEGDEHDGDEDVDVAAMSAMDSGGPLGMLSSVAPPGARGVGDPSRTFRRRRLDPDQRAVVIRDLLREIPFCVPFMDRVSIFRQIVASHARTGAFRYAGRQHLRVQRGRMYEDAFDAFSSSPDGGWSQPPSVTIVDAEGLPEAGIDGGGLFREFLQQAIKEAFDPDRGLFRTADDGGAYPNPDIHHIVPDAAQHFEFIGKLVGQALYTGMLLDLPLAQFFLTRILGKRNIFCQLASLDQQVYRSLAMLRTMSGEQLADLDLTFSATQGPLTGHRVVDLVPNGRNLKVTRANVSVYLVHMADYYLNRQIERASSSFTSGLHSVIPPEWLELFGPSELQMLLSGTQTDIDLMDMRRNTHLTGGFHDAHPTIVMFWRVVAAMTPEDRGLLLRFITSCPRPPLQGFAYLQPKLAIRNALDPTRLPTASTCVNLLKLPPYEDEETLRTKLLTAIRSNSGFHLS